MTEHENRLLGGWIRGLFESELSDELMSECSPKEFHLLVATLFDQSLRACQAKLLALETLRGGFERRFTFSFEHYYNHFQASFSGLALHNPRASKRKSGRTSHEWLQVSSNSLMLAPFNN